MSRPLLTLLRFHPLTTGGPISARLLSTTALRPAAILSAAEISAITAKEKELTGHPEPVAGGPTAQTQRHAGQAIDGDVLHDITGGEKKVTGGERVKGGPTSEAQRILSKGRDGDAEEVEQVPGAGHTSFLQ